MGLSGRKTKQRIPNDPRNLSWADNAAKFGQTYLSKFGWDTSQGLGVEGEGRTSAIKVSQKLDMLGIGMQHQHDPNGLAWRQNRDFENLLMRLNEGGKSEGPFHKTREDDTDEQEDGAQAEKANRPEEMKAGEQVEKEGKTKKGKKRKAEEEVDAEAEEEVDAEAEEKKERKRRKRDGKTKRKKEQEEKAPEQASTSTAPEATIPVAVVPIVAPAPTRLPPRSHRARIIAAKRLASSTPSALSEILGIPSSSILSTPAPPTAASTPAIPSSLEMQPMEKLTTSTQSVTDYFKTKLQAKTRTRSSLDMSTPVQGSDYDDAPRVGLGMSRGVEPEDTGPVRSGIGATSKFAAMFAPARAVEQVEGRVEGITDETPTIGDEEVKPLSKEERRKAKEEKRRKKEERKALGAEGIPDPDAQTKVCEATCSISVADESCETSPAKKKSRKKKSKDDLERKRKRSKLSE